jgi:hypothetical protein
MNYDKKKKKKKNLITQFLWWWIKKKKKKKKFVGNGIKHISHDKSSYRKLNTKILKL